MQNFPEPSPGPWPADSIPAQLAEACDQVRPAGPADAVAGVRAALVAAPASTQEASAVLRAAASLGLAVIPRGTGTKLAWGYPPRRADLILDTARLNQVVEHEAGDLVATVQAGVTLEQLAEVLARAGQRLALDPPAWQPPSGAGQGKAGTVGGTLATNLAGPLRLRYGTPRDLLIGITIVRADGTVAKSGGKVVKNVAGYDLGKLLAGSRGTLGLITQATFRLHPVPAATAYVTVPADGPEECARLLAVAQSPASSPVAAELDWAGPQQPVMLGLAIEGDPDGVTQRAAALAKLLSEAAGGSPVAVADTPPAWWGSRPAGAPDGTMLQVAFWAGRLPVVLAEIRAAAQEAGLDPAVGGCAAGGPLHVAIPAAASASQVTGMVTSLRAALAGPLAGTGATQPPRSTVVVTHAPAPVRDETDLFGPVPSLDLMRAVKQQFDPGRILSPGRFAGGI